MAPAVDLSLERLFLHLDEGYCLAELIEDSEERAIDYRFLRVNPAFSRLTGLSNAVGRTARELTPTLELKWIDRYAAIARGTKPERFEDASAAMGRHFDVFATPLGDGVRFALVFRDVTARKRAEDSLKESEERFRDLADHMSQLAWMADSNGWVFWYNRRWYDYTGTTLAEMQGWGWKQVHHPDHVERVVARIQHAWDSGEVWEDVFPLRGVDGQYRWFLSRAMPIRDAAGNVLRWFGTNTDVTEQRETEHLLRARTESLHLALRSAEAGDWRYDLQTDTLHPSPELRLLLGLGDADGAAWDGAVHDEDRERFQRELAEQLGGTSAELSLEFRCEHPVRGLRWMESVGSIERDPSGAPTACHGITRDITERKEREVHMQRVMAELNHRVKNTLAVVQSIARRTLRRAPDLATFRRGFEERLRSIAMANSLLTQSDWEGAALRAIIANELSSRVASADQAVIEGEDVQVPPSAAMALHMILHEWATNAVKYGALRWHLGRVEVSWRVDPDSAGVRWLDLSWREESPRQVEGSPHVGFGTQLVSQIVEHELGGTCERRFEPHGVAYRLRVPMSAVAAAATPAADQLRGLGDATRPVVLFAEDRAALAFGLRDELEEHGFTVLGPAATLAGATDLAERHPFDLALLDVDLGGESSHPLAQRLLAQGKRVVLLTGFSARNLPDALAGVTLLAKPVDMDELLAVLDPTRFTAAASVAAEGPAPAESAAGLGDLNKLAHDVRNTFATLRLTMGALRRDRGADPDNVSAVDEDLKLLYEQLRPLLDQA